MKSEIDLIGYGVQDFDRGGGPPEVSDQHADANGSAYRSNESA